MVNAKLSYNIVVRCLGVGEVRLGQGSEDECDGDDQQRSVEDELVTLRMQMTRRSRLSASESISPFPTFHLDAFWQVSPLLKYKGRPEITGDVWNSLVALNLWVLRRTN